MRGRAGPKEFAFRLESGAGFGDMLRLDPVSKRSCVIASGLQSTSAVKQGRNSAFPASRLYVSGFDGRLLELVPPAGVRP